MKIAYRLRRDEQGVAIIEMAFALPIFVVMLWMFVQLAQVYRALAGIQQALGEGARYATLCVSPTALGCSAPAASTVKTKIQNSVYGIGPGTFTVDDPTSGTDGTGSYYDLTVHYTQPTDLLLSPGPTITVARSKRVWVASS
ncbi:MAG: TadE/TadG family type IV pilus assembly protein [Sphingomicrobium sp.]